VIVPVQPRRLVWLVDAIETLRDFPREVRTELGFGLYLAQIGRKHEGAKPLHGLDAPVWELRAQDRSGTYRAVYVTHLHEAIYVLHAFQKKAKSGIATPRREIELIQRRLKLACELERAGGEG
jgi:phage-related protein